MKMFEAVSHLRSLMTTSKGGRSEGSEAQQRSMRSLYWVQHVGGGVGMSSSLGTSGRFFCSTTMITTCLCRPCQPASPTRRFWFWKRLSGLQPGVQRAALTS